MTSKIRTLMVGGALGTTVLVGLGGGAVAWAQTEGTTPTTEAPADGRPAAAASGEPRPTPRWPPSSA